MSFPDMGTIQTFLLNHSPANCEGNLLWSTSLAADGRKMQVHNSFSHAYNLFTRLKMCVLKNHILWFYVKFEQLCKECVLDEPLLKHVSTFTKPYRFHRSEYVYHTAIQLLIVGHNVSKRVKVSKVFHWQVDQRQQPVNGVLVGAQTHFGMSLCRHEPVRTRASDVRVWINKVFTHLTQCYSVFSSLFFIFWRWTRGMSL